MSDRRLIGLSWAIAVLVWAGMAWSAPPGALHVAVLETEVVGDLPDEERRAMVGMIDMLLIDSLSRLDGVVLVDRQALNAVLEELTLRVAGVAGRQEQVAEPLRPFWAAGVLVVSQWDLSANLLAIEAISAQTGILLGRLYVSAEQVEAELLRPRLEQLWGEVLAGAIRAGDRPLVEVSAELTEGLERSRWLTEEAGDAMRVRVKLATNVELLTPRHPLLTREERLLRLMGLSAAQEGDAAAALRAAPDVSVRVRVSEQPGVGRHFDETPITLTLVIDGRGDGKKETFSGERGQWPDLRSAATAWLDEQLASLGEGNGVFPFDDDERARVLAAREMAMIEPWTELPPLGSFRGLPDHLRVRLRDVALRASHLDPGSETAAWMAAALLAADNPNTRGIEQNFRIFEECRSYLDRFPHADRDRRHHILRECTNAGIRALRVLKRDATFEQFLEPPEGELYALASPTFRYYGTWAVDTRRLRGVGSGNAYEVFTRQIIRYLIPHIPAEKLDEEYAWWSRFFAEQVETLPEAAKARSGHDIAAPWELIDAAFAVRRGDVQAVRRKLEAAAAKVPRRETWVWGGDRHNPYLVPIFLKAAGDPEWETWRLTFGRSATVHVSLDEMTMLMAQLRGQIPAPWDHVSVPPIPGSLLIVPKTVRDKVYHEGSMVSRSAEAVLQTGVAIWLIVPGRLPGNSGIEVQLFVGQMGAERNGEVLLDIEAIPWPDTDELGITIHWSCAHVIRKDDREIVFMGTQRHGLLRLENVGDGWQGRWINTRHGLPFDDIRGLSTWSDNGQPQLMVSGSRRAAIEGQWREIRMVGAVNPQNDAVVLIYDGGVSGDHPWPSLDALMKDGSRVPLDLGGTGVYPQLPAIEEIAGIISGVGVGRSLPAHTISGKFEDNSARLWLPTWDGSRHGLFELDRRSLERLSQTAPGYGSSSDTVSVAVGPEASVVLGNIFDREGGNAYAAGRLDDWPSRGVTLAAGGGEVVWMAIATGAAANVSRQIVGYRPAPRDTGDWAAEDLWIGPFHTPNHETILGLRPAERPGTFLLSTTGHVLLLEETQLRAEAERLGLSLSTRQWREEYRAGLAERDWRVLVPALMSEGKHTEALDLLDGRRSERTNDPMDRLDRLPLDFWTARVLANTDGRQDDAIALYDRIAGHHPGPAEAFARANQIVLLHRAGAWAELLEVAEAARSRFPQMQSQRPGRGIDWYIAEARRRSNAEAVEPAGTNGMTE